jgi:hypothetical protein
VGYDGQSGWVENLLPTFGPLTTKSGFFAIPEVGSKSIYAISNGVNSAGMNMGCQKLELINRRRTEMS